MKHLNDLILTIFAFSLSCFTLWGQTKDDLAKGYNLIETQTYSQEEDNELLELFRGLRVTDVTDGMDMFGLPNTCLLYTSPSPRE